MSATARVDAPPASRTTGWLLYAACAVLSLLSIGFVVTTVLVLRQVYLNTR